MSQIRVMYLPLNYGDVIQTGVYDGFREAGCKLEIFDYYSMYDNGQSIERIRNTMIQRAAVFRPDLIHMQIQHTDVIDANTIRKIRQRLPKMLVSNWTGDVRNYVPRQFKDMAYASDFNFISSSGQLPLFKSEIPNKEIKYWQIGFNPALYYPDSKPREHYRYDVTFVGNFNTKENYPGHHARVTTAYSLRRTFGERFGLFGHGWPGDIKSKGSFDQKKLRELFHDSYCTISVNHYNNLSHYFSDRLLMCMACGRPTISLQFPNWESYFTNNCDLIIAESANDIVTKVKYLLKNKEFADYVGFSGAAKVFAEHTYLSRINELLEITGLRK